eukprot:gene28386-37468_t
MYGESEVEIDMSGTPPEITQKDLIAIYAESIAKADIELVLGDSNPGMYADFVSNSSAYLDARGLRANSFSLNGIIIENHSISTNVMQLLGRQ